MTYSDIIIEGIPALDSQHSPPRLPEEYMSGDVSSLPRIPLPNGKCVFYVRAPSSVVERFSEDKRVARNIIAHSWEDLFNGDYQYWNWVFDVEVSEIVEGQITRVRRKVALLQDQEIHGIYVPGIFAGDSLPNFPIPEHLSATRSIGGVNALRRSFSQKLIERIATNPRSLDEIEWRELERTVAEIFRGLGFEAELTPESKDGGKDVLIRGHVADKYKIYYIEIKHWRSLQKVGRDHVEQFINIVMKEKIDGGLFVSTYGYTAKTVESYSHLKHVRLGDEKKIVTLCETYIKSQQGLLIPDSGIGQLIHSETP